MRLNLLHNVQCRESFNETGDWVRYPQALQWAVKDFVDTGLGMCFIAIFADIPTVARRVTLMIRC